MLSYVTALNPYCTIYLYNRDRPNVLIQALVYIHVNDYYNLTNGIMIVNALFSICTIDQLLVLAPYYLPVCQGWEIQQNILSKYGNLVWWVEQNAQVPSVMNCFISKGSVFTLPFNLAIGITWPITLCRCSKIAFACGFGFFTVFDFCSISNRLHSVVV